MDKSIFALITFANSHLVLKAEKELENANMDIKVIPLPTEISAGCGLSIMCNLNTINDYTDVLDKTKVQYKKIYKIEKNGLSKKITQI